MATKKAYILLIIISLFFSFWLMFHTFSYENGTMLIATKAWSDFASHIPLIRSFSIGNNFPPEFPLFPGEPIRYHFLFYNFVGIIEKMGIRIDYALNIPSAISFAALLIIIYFLAKTLFGNKAIAILSVIFFLFNGSFSFIEFFKARLISLDTISDIFNNTYFPSFGPYDGKIVSAFWNLNIYTNQRHLALPLAFLLLIVFFVVHWEIRQKKIPLPIMILLGMLIGVMPLFHSSLFIMSIVIIAFLLLVLPRQRFSLLILLLLAGFISIPRVYFLSKTATFVPHFQPGYLIANNLTYETFITFWMANLGFFFFLIPLGFLFSSNLAKKILIAFFSLFIIGNLIQFSPEMAGNHKFFNAFIILGNMFVAFLIVRFWGRSLLTKTIIALAFPFLIFSGIIDFFPIKNDVFVRVADYSKNKDVAWIMENMSKDAVFLNSSYLYHPANLAGRKIFLGWPYYPWSLGYDTLTRDSVLKKLYNTNDIIWVCKTLKKNSIDYITIDKIPDPVIFVNQDFFVENFEMVYKNSETGFTIFKTQKKCNFIT